MKNKNLLASKNAELRALEVEKMANSIIQDWKYKEDKREFYRDFPAKLLSAKSAWALVDKKTQDYGTNNTLYTPLWSKQLQNYNPRKELGLWLKPTIVAKGYKIYTNECMFEEDEMYFPEAKGAVWETLTYKDQLFYKLEITDEILPEELGAILEEVRNLKLDFILLCKQEPKNILDSIEYIIFDAYDGDGYIIFEL